MDPYWWDTINLYFCDIIKSKRAKMLFPYNVIKPLTVAWSDTIFSISQRNTADGAPFFAEHAELYVPDNIRFENSV
jgi:hypothetical protein